MLTIDEIVKAIKGTEMFNYSEMLLQLIGTHGKRFGEELMRGYKSYTTYQERKIKFRLAGLSSEDSDYHNRKLDKFTAMKPNCKLQALPVPDTGNTWELTADDKDTENEFNWIVL